MASTSSNITNQNTTCQICDGVYRLGYQRQHLLSMRHKRAVSQGAGVDEANRGIILRSTTNHTVYDLFFASTSTSSMEFSADRRVDDDEALLLANARRTIENFFAAFQSGILYRMEEALSRHNCIKVSASLSLTLKRCNVEEDDEQTVDESLRTTTTSVMQGNDLSDWFDDLVSDLLLRYEEMPLRGSNWTLCTVNDFEIHISRYNPLSASSYVALPRSIAVKHAVINVQNHEDNMCFAYSILSKTLHERGVAHPERVSKYTREIWAEYDFDGIRYPTPFADIGKFELKNRVSVNVYGLEDDDDNDANISRSKKHTIYPIRISEACIDADRHFDLLFLQTNDEPMSGHYCYIARFNALVSSQLTAHHGSLFICRRCLLHFTQQDTFELHRQYCNAKHVAISQMPSEEQAVCTFEKNHFQQRVPYIVYADFECALQPFSMAPRDPLPAESYTNKRHLHIPTSYCYYIVSCNDADETSYEPKLYRGPDAVQHFWENIRLDLGKISDIYRTIVPMMPTAEDRERLGRVYSCHICGRVPLNITSGELVIDHCHLTGKVRGWACRTCNFQYRLPTFVPIVLHNGSNYDFKFIVSHIYSEVEAADVNRKVSVLAKNCENLISFEVEITDTLSARFLDSFRFMASSLSSLANNLSDEQMRHVSRFYGGGDVDAEHFQLARRKGVFPYEYIRGFEQYEETQLPPIDAFYSILSDESITRQEYEHATRVWSAYNCHNLGEYSDQYLIIDVLLLADIFENFRSLCLEVYKLDAVWHYSAPGLAWNAMLKVTGVKLELLTDNTMYLFCEGAIRGGYCAVSERYVRANNPMVPNYDSNRESNYLLYVDANNLYGHAMSMPLPSNNFSWLEPEELEALDIRSIAEDSAVGYVLEVDVAYPRELHRLHNDIPFFPQQLTTSSRKGAPKKLMATLFDKERYIVHYRYLQLALECGLELKKVHRGIKFHQSRWMDSYIGLNNARRTAATNEFAKDFFKLMNNSVFGKFLESVRKHRYFELTNSPQRLAKLTRKPNFKNRIILNERTNLVLVELGKTRVRFDKFIQAGGAILDLAKRTMYEFHYKTMKNQIFPNNAVSLAYTDTDSLIYNIQVPNLVQHLIPHMEHFDFSEYSIDHPLYDPTNKKKLGKMKDECKGLQMVEFCGLRAKLYSFVLAGRQFKKAKGIKKSVINKSMSFEDYVACLTNRERSYRHMCSIRSYHHQIHTIQQKKLALSALDDKRYVLEDGIHTLAWGHCDIPAGRDLIALLE